MDYKKITDEISEKILSYSQDTSGWRVIKVSVSEYQLILLMKLPVLNTFCCRKRLKRCFVLRTSDW